MNDKIISTNNIRIEKCTDTHVASALASIAAETFTQAYGRNYKPEDIDLFMLKHHTVDNYRKMLCDPAFAVWLARDAGGEVVGYVVAGPCRLPLPGLPDNSGELLRFYILDEYQGAGLGKRMMDMALDWLDDNYEQTYLSVYAKNPGAQRFYARFGFEKTHDYFYLVGNQADPEFIMKRRKIAR